MLKNIRYDKIKLVHKLSCLVWFIEKHGLEDAKTAGEEEAAREMHELKQDLQKHLEKLDKLCCCNSKSGGCSACE